MTRKVPKSSFSYNSTADGPTYFTFRPKCSKSGAAMRVVPRTADFLVCFVSKIRCSKHQIILSPGAYDSVENSLSIHFRPGLFSEPRWGSLLGC